MSTRSPVQSQAQPTFTPVQTGILQRKCSSCGQHTFAGGECEECKKKKSLLQRRSVNQAEPSEVPPIVHEVLRSPGQPLEQDTRVFMESRFGHDFSQVRVHTDAKADKSARAVNALAYTVKQNIVFGLGRYTPRTSAGQRLLAHELTHVIQQANLSSTAQQVSSPADPYEQEANQVSEKFHSPHRIAVQSDVPAKALVMRDIISANPSPSGGGGRPPGGLTGCHVYLGGRRIEHWLAGTLGYRHLYIDVFEGRSNYALIEAGPVGSTTGGTSGAWVKSMDWDARGIQWDITPSQNCPTFVSCLKSKTAAYHGKRYSYDYMDGPNSNSFVGWALNECGLNISPLVSSYPYLGVDYWTRPAPVPVPLAVTVPATP